MLILDLPLLWVLYIIYYNVAAGCFRMEASGMHRQEALTR
jgi:hypothetical protein